MEDYPRNLAEFETRFAGEQVCREYLCQLRWRGGFSLSADAAMAKAWAVRTVLLECAGCGHQASATAGTIFQDTRKTPPELVSSNVVAHQPEERGERTGIAAGCWAWAATRLPGLGCTSSGAPWCGPDAIDSAGAWRLTRPT